MKKKKQIMNERTSLYIIAQTTGLDVQKFRKTNLKGIFKIGISGDAEKRIKSMNGGPVELELISEYEFNTRTEAIHAEKLIHKLLYAYHHKHEWFSLDHDNLVLLDNVICHFLNGSCHYYEKEYFVTPKLTPDEMLEKTSVDFLAPSDRKPFKP